MGMLVEGFFDRVDVVAEVMASASTAAQGGPTEAPIPPHKPVPTKGSTQAKRVGKSVPIPAKIPTPQKEVTPTYASRTGSASLATPSIISASDPFVALSQAVKDGFSLVVTHSFPSSDT